MAYHIQPDGRYQAEGLTLYTAATNINTHGLQEGHNNDIMDHSQSVSATLGPLLAHTQIQNLTLQGAPTGVILPTSLPPLQSSVVTNPIPTITTAAGVTTKDPPPKKKPQILEKMKQLRDQGKYCDVIIDVKGVRFRAHKNVLAAWSPYFDLHLNDAYGLRDLLIVHYDNSDVFSDLLDFLYTGCIAPRETNFLELLHLAVSFQIELLQNDCEEYLRSNLHLGNFMSTYFLARKYRIHSLEEFVVGFLQMNLSDAVKQNEFLSLTFNQFDSLLSGNCMEQVKPEIKLFLIISWVGFEVQKRESFLVMLLKHIDWSTVASDFLLEISRTENFFTTHESSLYLLLQTLYSSSISLGPYVELFPALRLTYSHILKNTIYNNKGVRSNKKDDYYPVTVTASVACKVTNKTDVSINTDVTGPDIEAAMPESYSLFQEKELGNQDQSEEYFDEESEKFSYVPPNVSESGESFHGNTQEGTNRNSQEPNNGVKILVSLSPEHTISGDKKEKQNKKPAKSLKKGRKTPKQKEIPVKTKEDENEKESPVLRKSKRGLKPKKIYMEEEENVEPEEDEKDDEEFSHVKKAKNAKKPRKKQQQDEDRTKEEDDFLKNSQDDDDDDDDDDYEVDEEDQRDEGDSETNNIETSNDNTEISTKRKKIQRKTKFGLKKKRSTKFIGKNDDIVEDWGERTEFCNYDDCDFAASNESGLRHHIVMAHTQVTYPCNICNITLNFNGAYKRHMRKHFNGPPYKCDERGCWYENDNFMTMLYHRMTHCEEKPFKCDICSRSFRRKNNLIQHRFTHTGKRTFACPVCGKMFLLKNTLDQHMACHSDVKSYLCDLCGFSTKYQSHLTSHKRIHSGDVFPCTFPNCDYTTPRRSQLKSHMRAHLQIREHHCSVCGRSFVEKSHLNRHIKIHSKSDEGVLFCEFCLYKTARKDKMKEHFEKYHGENATAKGPYKTRKSRIIKTETQQFHVLPESCKFDHPYTMQPPLQLDGNSAIANRIFQEIQGQQISIPGGQNLGASTVTLPVSMPLTPAESENLQTRLTSTQSSTIVSNTVHPGGDAPNGTSIIIRDASDSRSASHENSRGRSLLQNLDHHRALMQENSDHQSPVQVNDDHQAVLQEGDHQAYVQQQLHMSTPVPLSQAIINQAFAASQNNQSQAGQSQDFSGLNAFMALF